MEHDIVLTEHKKLQVVQPQSQACGEFIEWLQDQGIALCRYDSRCDHHIPIMERREDLLASFFEIDQQKLEREKQMLLAAQRELNGSRR